MVVLRAPFGIGIKSLGESQYVWDSFLVRTKYGHHSHPRSSRVWVPSSSQNYPKHLVFQPSTLCFSRHSQSFLDKVPLSSPLGFPLPLGLATSNHSRSFEGVLLRLAQPPWFTQPWSRSLAPWYFKGDPSIWSLAHPPWLSSLSIWSLSLKPHEGLPLFWDFVPLPWIKNLMNNVTYLY